MNKVHEVQEYPGLYIFECPGCNLAHQINTNPGYGIVWQFNKDLIKPTVSPSLLVQWTEGEEHIPHVCHSFIKEGKIQFLGDCTHSLANQTVDL